ncbi:FAD-binding oxidoreductase [Streptomyces sp. NPDC046977]|uniref:FAD-binding oxidoreductase n=1 Tax=Streptomyces sp. NPDC046977 TaxID=3154703 RepID=UPI0033E968B2
MAPRVLDDTALDALRSGFDGEVVTPGDPVYDENRTVFNAMIDRRPAVVALCESSGDVASALRFAGERGLEVAVRGGGHSVAGNALNDGGLVVDLRRMHAVVVDPRARTARVGGGALMTHLDRATQPYDLATTGGRVSTTGVGGLALGGGSGWLERRFGLACDSLEEVELVTADGTMVRAAQDENPELFWALHGGGGNFGVATSLTLRLHQVPRMTAALLLWPSAAGPEVVRAYRDFMESAPPEVGGAVLYATAPPEDFVPPHMAGALVAAALVTYIGQEEPARELIAPLLSLSPEGSMIAELPYAELQCLLDNPPGYRNYWSAEYLSALPDEAVERFYARSRAMVVPSPSQQVLFPGGGAMAHGPDDYPLPWRRAAWVAHPFGLWESPADDGRARQWAHDVREDMKPWSIGAVYLNFIGDEGEGRVIAGFGAHNLSRLARVKTEYDPGNVFRLNHNIEPG